MIEIVFGDSACGSLKIAQHYGKGDYNSGVIGVFIGQADGGKAGEEEINAARREAEKQSRRDWESAVPMGGNSADVYGFPLMLSIGDISEDVLGEKRMRALKWLYGIYPDSGERPLPGEDMFIRAKDSLAEVHSRLTMGESARVWYSNQPDELCGLYWLLAQIEHLNLPNGRIHIVALPDWEVGEDGSVVTHCGWGGIKPGDWHRYTGLQSMAARAFREDCAAHWKRLQHENTPLRAVLNGRLVSVPETIYDGFILREIAAAEDEFHEAVVIGKVLGKHALGIGDAWIAQRIEGMISAGDLIPVTEPAPDSPVYHRRLKKHGNSWATQFA